MKRTALLVSLAALLLAALLFAAALPPATPKKPKLVVAIVIDQFRYDYLFRFRSEYHTGFDRLLTKGALFTNANYIHFPTLTAVGHSTFLSGATPSVSGIIGNDWYDRQEHQHVTSVSDDQTELLGGSGPGASPHRLLVSTVGDELKMAGGEKSHVIGISLKDRAAILPAGHMANAAYWFDLNACSFVSSSYYFRELPGWVKDFNAGHPADKYRGTTWLTHKFPTDPKEFCGDNERSPLESSPIGNELVETLAERALSAEQLGKHEFPDVLTVSFSSNDKVGHDYGSYSPEEHDITVRTDQTLDKLFQAIDRQVGLANTLIVLTGDHGVAPSPDETVKNRMPGGRISATAARSAIESALNAKYGAGDWVAGTWDLLIFLNRDFIAEKKLDAAEVRRVAAQAVFAMPHVFRVYTSDQLATGAVPPDEVTRRVTNGFNMRRAADIVFLPEPYWTVSKSVTTHGTPFSYDAHVPVIFMGPGIRPGRYDAPVAINDIAPTLATILEVETPSGSIGRVLAEMFN